MNIELAIAVAIGLTVGNFIYQAAASQDYRLALERSFFQTSALLILWIAERGA